MNTAIIYTSKHHGNTKKVLEALQSKYQLTLIEVNKAKESDLAQYDLIGFASGIYAFNFDPEIIKWVKEKLPLNRQGFLLYTYGIKGKNYSKSIEQALEQKKAKIVGTFSCAGWNTFGPFKLVGGLSKGHPDSLDLQNAQIFYQELLNNFGL